MADEGDSLARRVFAERPPRDPFMEAVQPGLLASGNPAAAATYGTAEGFPTGPAPSLYERLATLAQYAGNALPGRGGVEFGRLPPRLVELLRNWVTYGGPDVPNLVRTSEMGVGVPPAARAIIEQELRMPMEPWVRPRTIDPGGSSMPARVTPEAVTRLLETTPAQQAKDLLLYENMLHKRGPLAGPRGLGPESVLPPGKVRLPSRQLPSRKDLD